MLELKLKSTTRNFPEHISELDNRQWNELADSYLLMQGGFLDFKAMCVRLVYRFLDMRRSVDASKDENQQLCANVAHLAQIIEGFFSPQQDQGKLNYQIKLDFYHNPLPELQIDKKLYKAPDTLVSGTKFGNYVQALNAYNDYARSNDHEDLQRLINAWYRPVDNDCPIDVRLVSPTQQLIIFVNFAATQLFIVNAKKLDIGGGVEVNLSQLFKGDGGKKSHRTNFGMVGALYNLAKEGTFGDKEKTENTDTWEVLTRMAQLHEDGKQKLRDAKKQRNKGARR